MAKGVKQLLLARVLTFQDAAQMNDLFAQYGIENLALAELKLGLKIIARDNWIQLESESGTTLLRGYDFFVFAKEFVSTHDYALIKDEFERMILHAVQTKYAQCFYLKSLRGKEVVFVMGPAGTGQSYFAMTMAVCDLLSEHVKRFILTSSEYKLNFSCRNVKETLLRYLRPLRGPLYQMMKSEKLTQLVKKKVIKLAPFTSIREHLFYDAFIILDEAKITPPDLLMMLLTRLFVNAKHGPRRSYAA